jgi:protocatechuate 3,4-dioxygenase alpha subunit
MTLKQTPSQTVGPYFAYGLTPEQYGYRYSQLVDGDMAAADIEGTHIQVEGLIYDGQGKSIPDAVVEIWQADAAGRYAHPADPRGSNADFSGFGRYGTGPGADDPYRFHTIKPGAVADGQAPHLNVTIMMRGLLVHVFSRIYFSDEAEANATDKVLQSVPEDRRATLIAQRHDTPAGIVYKHDIHMQGDNETVFFDV